MRVLWSTDPDVGEVDVWFDGVQVVAGAHAATLADSNSAFVQFGLLRGDADFSDVPVIYVDDALEGASLAEVRGVPAAMPADAGRPLEDAGVDAASARTDGSSGPQRRRSPRDRRRGRGHRGFELSRGVGAKRRRRRVGAHDQRAAPADRGSPPPSSGGMIHPARPARSAP